MFSFDRRARGVPLLVWLLLLLSAVAVPLILAGAGTLWLQYRQDRANAERQLLAQARSLAMLIDVAFGRAETAAQVLAASRALATADRDALRSELRDTQRLLSTGLPPGIAPPRIRVFDAAANLLADTLELQGIQVEQGAAAPPQRALATGRTQFSELMVGPRTGLRYVVVAVPATAPNGKVYGAVAIGVPRERLLAIAQRAELPPGGVISVHDRTGTVVARGSRDEEALGRRPPPSILRPMLAAPAGVLHADADTLESVPAVLAFAHAPVSGYVVKLNVPEAAFVTAVRSSMFRSAVIGVVVLALGALAALFIGRHIVGAFRRLPSFGERGPPRGRWPALREANELAVVLADAAARRHAAELALTASEARLRALNQDLGERVEREVAAREAAQARAAHAERMQALGQLAGGISHDFNNVLQANNGAAALIGKRAADPDSVSRIAGMIMDTAQRGASVTRRLLAFARRGDLRPQPIDTADLLAGLSEVLAHALGSLVQLRLDAPPGLPSVLADKGQLETVLVNLATNARDAMQGSGTLLIAARAERVGPQRTGVQPATLPAGDYVRISVADEGVGMDASTLERAFEPFFTTKKAGEGTGLGLPMAKGFVEQSGGALALESSPGIGTTVQLWLPQAGAAAPPSGSDDRPQPEGTRNRLLVVDDDPMIRELLATHLEDTGYEVARASDGDQALAIVADRSQPPFAALVTDLSMPGRDGLSLIRAAQAERPGLPAILLTGYAEDPAVLSALGLPGRKFMLLRKPVTPQQLSDQVSILLMAGE